MPVTRTLPRASTADAASSPAAEDVALIAKALAHPVRIRIVRLLLEKPACIGYDIVSEVGLAQSTVSEHLRVLKAAGVIRGETEHPRVCYSLNPEGMMPLAALLALVFDKARRGELDESVCCVTPDAG
jgi:ArsR family transcriptional regulator, arsenate/arsenite/antimonite-responsive transcriptional repressor